MLAIGGFNSYTMNDSILVELECPACHNPVLYRMSAKGNLYGSCPRCKAHHTICDSSTIARLTGNDDKKELVTAKKEEQW